jgi:hypothetical protein
LLATDIWLKTTRRVTLYQDAIAVTSWSGTRVLRTDEISCRRMGRTGKYQNGACEALSAMVREVRTRNRKSPSSACLGILQVREASSDFGHLWL